MGLLFNDNEAIKKEVEEKFEVHREAKKATIHFLHIGKSIAYEIPFRGRLFSENEDRFNGLEKANWQQI